jgi:hypothetical protein
MAINAPIILTINMTIIATLAVAIIAAIITISVVTLNIASAINQYLTTIATFIVSITIKATTRRPRFLKQVVQTFFDPASFNKLAGSRFV